MEASFPLQYASISAGIGSGAEDAFFGGLPLLIGQMQDFMDCIREVLMVFDVLPQGGSAYQVGMKQQAVDFGTDFVRSMTLT